jgi:glycosyltransferase involved in cell wall biosynthesis
VAHLMEFRHLRAVARSGLRAARVVRRRLRWQATLARRKARQRFVEPHVLVRQVPRTICHVQGPTEISYALDELVVLCVVRNGELYVRSFLDHYAALPVRHIVFLDNGSTDRTVDLLREHDVTVLSSNAPYQRYETPFRHYLVNRFASGRWSLTVDVDEFFDYPYSDRLELRDFLRYLNQARYTAVIAQMLDMFVPGPLSAVRSDVDDDLKAKYTHYEITALRKEPYRWPGVSDARVKWHFGGVRGDVFGTNNSLTKAALLFRDRRLKPFAAVHHVRGARIADVSCVLLHYPFVESFREKVEEAVRTRRYTDATWEYDHYWRTLERDPDVNLGGVGTQRLGSTDELLDDGFLVVSESYRRWVVEHSHRPPPPRQER